MRGREKIAIGLAALALGACDSARRSEVIDGMRVLAIKAEPPSARPGDAVTLEALVASTKEDDDRIEYTWFFCTIEFEDCAEAPVPGEGIVILGSGRSVTVEVPENTLAGDRVTVWLDVTRGSRHERSIKGVYVHQEEDASPNRNPRLDRVRWGVASGAPLATMPKEDRATIHLGSTAMMSELRKEAGEPAAEDVVISTYVTAGQLVDPSGSGASGALYFESPDEKTRVGTWIVVNDGRGGVDWVEHWISVEGKKP